MSAASDSDSDDAGLPTDLEEGDATFSQYRLRPRTPLQHQSPADARSSGSPAEARNSEPGAGAAEGGSGMRWKKTFKVICPWMFKGGIFKTMNTINVAIALAGSSQETVQKIPFTYRSSF